MAGSNQEKLAPDTVSSIEQTAWSLTRPQVDVASILPKQPLPKNMDCFVCIESLPCSQMKMHQVCRESICSPCIKKTVDYFKNRQPENDLDNGSFSCKSTSIFINLNDLLTYFSHSRRFCYGTPYLLYYLPLKVTILLFQGI